MKRLFLGILFLLCFCRTGYSSISVDSFLSADDVTIGHLEEFRTTVVNAINSASGTDIQDGTITSAKFDANSNPENRWNEAFESFVYTGLLPITGASLTTNTAAGTAYIDGVRVVKDSTGHTYTANKNTYIDLSKTGVFTYSEISQGAAVPAVAANSIRLAMVSSDSANITHVVNCQDLGIRTLNDIFQINDSNYNGATTVLTLSHRTGRSGVAPAAGIGAELKFLNDRTFTSTNYSTAKIIGALTNVTSGNGSIYLYAINGGSYSTWVEINNNGDILPSAAGTAGNLGNASLYWNDVSYKTLTDRGCLGWFDEGVELQDGSIVSDTEAIKAMKKHPTKKTIYGTPMLDYKSFPKVSYKKAKIGKELLPRDENDEPIGGSDGVEMTSVFSIMIGAIKELDARVEALEAEVKILKSKK